MYLGRLSIRGLGRVSGPGYNPPGRVLVSAKLISYRRVKFSSSGKHRCIMRFCQFHKFGNEVVDPSTNLLDSMLDMISKIGEIEKNEIHF